MGYLVKLLSNHKTTLSHKNLENISNNIRKIKAKLLKEYAMSLKKVVYKDRASRNGMQE